MLKLLTKAPLSSEIQKEYKKLIDAISKFSPSERTVKKIAGTGGIVSITDLIAYQIGWGKLLLEWYHNGLKGKPFILPGEGFNSWDYTGLALHFYKKYQFDSSAKQLKEFDAVVQQILEMTEKEFMTGHLDRTGVWPWCTLKSGKQWPLSKWIKVNTASPYKKAATLIRTTTNIV